MQVSALLLIPPDSTDSPELLNAGMVLYEVLVPYRICRV